MTIETFFGPVIHTFSREQAVADGVLEHVADIGEVPVYATVGCVHHLELNDNQTLLEVLAQVQQALLIDDPEDDERRRLRVLQRGEVKFWVIEEPGVITLLRPGDY